MADLCIQIHPHLAPNLDLASLRSACEHLDKTLVYRFAVVEGTDAHVYTNLMFATDDLKELWRLLHERLYQSAEFGLPLRASSMAMCEGQHGWDDYLLLYHFDPKVPRDAFPE